MNDQLHEQLRGFLVLVDGLDDLLHEGRPSVFGGRVEIDRAEAWRHLTTIEAVSRRLGTPAALVELVDALREQIGDPGEGLVRVHRERMYDTLDRLRVALPAAARAQHAMAEEPRTYEVDVTPELRVADLVRHVEDHDETVRLLRDGTVVAELRRPRP
ncbi:hypothetical protein GKE82_15460 [Conexibacter sp. W3-3-2]|uniref:hypothetical protein n=1 Tax=Conexibacter sp. W3-3-2 TaxID=2675227 RepID=UPI0012B96DB9|nr:hypothetical protein [Conexibacter sp. W3-3-2]MTD45645.1 hypothetical protein [Conexibacter sp. W3-3-2]